MIDEFLFKLGIPTYIESVFTSVPDTAEQQFNLPKQMPTQIGWIYGLSIYVGTVTPTNTALITMTDATNLFLVLKSGQSNFIESLRLDDMIFNQATGVRSRYLEISVPNDISLDASFYQNPTGIIGPKQIMLNIHYISNVGRQTLVENGIIGVGGTFKARQ